MTERQNNIDTYMDRFVNQPVFCRGGQTIDQIVINTSKDQAKATVRNLVSTSSITAINVITSLSGRANSWGYDKELDHIWLWEN